MKNPIKPILLILVLVLISNTAFSQLHENRIVSLVPSNTELLFAMGFGKQIVGVTDYCNFPEEANAIPKIGGLELNIEKLLSLKPTALIDLNFMHRRYELLFRQLGLNYISVNIKNLTDVPTAAIKLAEIMGEKAKGEKFSNDWNVKLSSLKLNKINSEVKVYFEIWDTPMQAAGNASFIGEIISSAGGTNIVDSATDFPVINSEMIIEKNPDIIFISYPLTDTTSISKRSGWSLIEAVKRKRIITLNQDVFVRPSPRNLEAIEILNKHFKAIRK